jgi:hypothetical protein
MCVKPITRIHMRQLTGLGLKVARGLADVVRVTTSTVTCTPHQRPHGHRMCG